MIGRGKREWLEVHVGATEIRCGFSLCFKTALSVVDPVIFPLGPDNIGSIFCLFYQTNSVFQCIPHGTLNFNVARP